MSGVHSLVSPLTNAMGADMGAAKGDSGFGLVACPSVSGGVIVDDGKIDVGITYSQGHGVVMGAGIAVVRGGQLSVFVGVTSGWAVGGMGFGLGLGGHLQAWKMRARMSWWQSGGWWGQ